MKRKTRRLIIFLITIALVCGALATVVTLTMGRGGNLGGGIQLAAPRPVDASALARGLDELEAAARCGDNAATLALIARLVPEYSGARPADLPISAPISAIAVS